MTQNIGKWITSKWHFRTRPGTWLAAIPWISLLSLTVTGEMARVHHRELGAGRPAPACSWNGAILANVELRSLLQVGRPRLATDDITVQVTKEWPGAVAMTMGSCNRATVAAHSAAVHPKLVT